MPKIISEETAKKAKELRKQGLTFDQISQELDISKTWCKTNLKNISSEKTDRIRKLAEKARSSSGVSKGEIFKELELSQLNEEDAHKQLSNSVKTIRRKGKDCIVRPNWMMPEFSEYITKAVIETSMLLEDRCHDQAIELRESLLESCETEEQKQKVPSVLMLKQAILSIGVVSVSTRPGTSTRLQNWLESLHNSAVALGNRNVSSVVESKSEHEMVDFDEDLFY